MQLETRETGDRGGKGERKRETLSTDSVHTHTHTHILSKRRARRVVILPALAAYCGENGMKVMGGETFVFVLLQKRVRGGYGLGARKNACENEMQA